jgi:hypothetical protein
MALDGQRVSLLINRAKLHRGSKSADRCASGLHSPALTLQAHISKFFQTLIQPNLLGSTIREQQ